MPETTALTNGLHHLGLTVPDIHATAAFFEQVLGFRRVGEKADYPAIFVRDDTVMLTLWQVRDPDHAAAFNRHTSIGLHHFALKIAPTTTLEAVQAAAERAHEVSIEFAPEPLGKGPSRHMMLTIPGGIRMEVIAPA